MSRKSDRGEASSEAPLSANRFALLVGVSDYRVFDLSAGQPRGTSDLFGPPQNLSAMWDFCIGLGYTAADVALLASPLQPPRGGHPAMYAAATRASILDGVRLLAARLASGAESQGLVYFTGHGDAIEGVGPVLCTEDTEVCDGELRNVVSLAEIAALLETHAPGHAVTMVLDSCRSGLTPTARRRALGRLRTVARLRDRDTLITATGPEQSGAEILVDGAWRGALTWALCSAAAPYVRIPAGDFRVPDLSAGSWVERARLLLRGMSVAQRPELYGDAEAAALQPTGTPPVTVTNRLADQRSGSIEIYGDESGQITGNEPKWVTFDLTETNTNLVGKLITSYATPSSAMPAYSDFWSWPSSPGWPNNFKVTYVSVGTAGQNSPPGNLPPGQPMMAFPAGLTQSAFTGTQSTSGYQVWAILDAEVQGQCLGYLLRGTGSGNPLKWLITWPGYSQSSQLLTNLPAPGGTGGVEISDDSDALYFSRITSPPANLGSIVAAYNVLAASQS